MVGLLNVLSRQTHTYLRRPTFTTSKVSNTSFRLPFHSSHTHHEFGIVIKQHEELRRPLRRFFEEMYHEALRCRLMEQGR